MHPDIAQARQDLEDCISLEAAASKIVFEARREHNQAVDNLQAAREALAKAEWEHAPKIDIEVMSGMGSDFWTDTCEVAVMDIVMNDEGKLTEATTRTLHGQVIKFTCEGREGSKPDNLGATGRVVPYAHSWILWIKDPEAIKALHREGAFTPQDPS